MAFVLIDPEHLRDLVEITKAYREILVARSDTYTLGDARWERDWFASIDATEVANKGEEILRSGERYERVEHGREQTWDMERSWDIER